MKKLLLLLFFTTSIFAETANDSIPKKMSSSDLFSDYDIVLIDSLLMDSKYKSPLYNTLQYRMDDVDKKAVTDVALSTQILKQRLATIDAKTPFHIAYNPALKK